MNLDEIYDDCLNVLEVGLDGHGIAQSENSGSLCNVPFVIPGEKIRFIDSKKAKFEFIKKSPDRIDPPCQHYMSCGGCTFQHFSKEAYQNLKLKLVSTALKNNLIDVPELQSFFVPPHSRRRVCMEAKKWTERLVFGFHEFRTIKLVDVFSCKVMHERIESVLPGLRDLFERILQIGEKAKVFCLKSSGNFLDIGIEIVYKTSLSESERSIFEEFGKKYEIDRLQFRYKKSIDTIIALSESTVMFDGVSVSADPWGFLQASEEAENFMTNAIKQILPTGNLKFADLFSGRGTFSFPMSSCGFVDAYEWDMNACAALLRGAKENDRSIELFKRNLFDNPLSAQELSIYDFVVIDPPRSGAEEQCKFLAISSVPAIFVVSCCLETFIRDIKILIVGGYTLSKLWVIDQFLWAPHVELAGLLILNR